MAEMHVIRIRRRMTTSPALKRLARMISAPLIHQITTHITLPASRSSGWTTTAARDLFGRRALPIAENIPWTSERLLCCGPHRIGEVHRRACRISKEVEHPHQLAWAMTEQQSLGHLQDHGPGRISGEARND